MRIIEPVVEEFQYEAGTTRKFLERVPEGQYTWKPHDKSMSMGQLAAHIVEIPEWAAHIVDVDEMTFNIEEYKPPYYETQDALLEAFDKNVADAAQKLETVSDEAACANWRMVMNGNPVIDMPRIAVIRTMVLNHAVHHRGQFSVYLRLCEIPVPAVYGPSADEQSM